METNVDNESFTEEMNADLKSASEADTLPMDAKASGPATVALKTTSQVSMYFTAIKYLDIYLCLVLLKFIYSEKGHKILRNLRFTFDYSKHSQK
jgi:hypothetical protein